MVKVLIRETFGSEDSLERLYVENEENINNVVIVPKQTHRWLTLSSIKLFFTSVFLPAGYPESVSEDYMEYQLWDSIQAFASSIMNNLGTHSILKGVGVGDSSATVLAATITWLLRDGTSMSGRIVFAYIQSSKLDADCKKWRLFADLINDISIFIDLLSPYFSNYFLYMQCLSGVMKSLVGTAGGATRAALTQHQSRRNNMADVSAKDGSQETLVNLMALLCSLFIVPLVSEYSSLVWLLFISFTILHIYANYRAVKCVSIEIFNLSRFAIFVENYLKNDNKNLKTKIINKTENIWFFFKDRFDAFEDNIRIGVPLNNHSSDRKQLSEIIKTNTKSNNCGYILSRNQTNQIQISLNKSSDCLTILESVFEGIVICLSQRNDEIFCSKFSKTMNSMKGIEDNKKLLELSRIFTQNYFEDLKLIAQNNGWNLNRLLIVPNEWRYELTINDKYLM